MLFIANAGLAKQAKAQARKKARRLCERSISLKK